MQGFEFWVLAVFYGCLLILLPYLWLFLSCLIAPLWVRFFPTKYVQLEWMVDEKAYVITVPAVNNLSEASSRLRLHVKKNSAADCE